jgi:pre-rRNA-processing protein IPI3
VMTCSSSKDSFVSVWNPSTLSVLATYKECACSSLTKCGDRGFLAAQTDRTQIKTYTWNKQNSNLKSVVSERMTAMETTSVSGLNLFAGGTSGKMYVWDTSSGVLIRTWDAHYKAVTQIKISSDNSMLYTSGEDGIVHVWNILRLLGDLESAVSPVRTFRGHTLPVTDIYLTPCFSNGGSRLFTSSLDQTCRIYDTRSEKAIFVVSCPSMLKSVTVDPSEYRVFLGGSNSQIFQVDLHVVAASQTAATVAALATKRGDSDVAITPTVWKGHKHSVCCLETTRSGNRLISGDESGLVIVWDTRSQQQLRTFEAHKGMGSITSIDVFSKLQFQRLQNRKILNDAMVPLRKFRGVATDLQRAPCVVFETGAIVRRIPSKSTNFQQLKMDVVTAFSSSSSDTTTTTTKYDNEKELERLKRKLKETEAELGRWKAASGKLIAATTKRRRR